MRFHGAASSAPDRTNLPNPFLAIDDPHQECHRRHQAARGLLMHVPVEHYCTCPALACTGPCCATDDPREVRSQ